MTVIGLTYIIFDACRKGEKTFTYNGFTYTLPTPQTAGTITQQSSYLRDASEKLAMKIISLPDFEIGSLTLRRSKDGMKVAAFFTYISGGKKYDVIAHASGGGYDKEGAAVSRALNDSPLISILNAVYSKRVPQTYKHAGEPLEFDVDGHKFEDLLHDLGFKTLILQDRKYFTIYKK